MLVRDFFDKSGIDLANKLKFPFLGTKCLCGAFYRKKAAKINWDIGILMNSAAERTQK